MERHIAVPFSEEELKELHAGDYIYLTGTIYSARDAAHKRMYDAICVEQEKHPEVDYTGAKLYEDKILPLDITGNTIYYLGPTPAKPGQVIGSAGPTTSSRMDKYTPLLLSKGLKGMIGKGKRSQAVIDAIVKEKAGKHQQKIRKVQRSAARFARRRLDGLRPLALLLPQQAFFLGHAVFPLSY